MGEIMCLTFNQSNAGTTQIYGEFGPPSISKFNVPQAKGDQKFALGVGSMAKKSCNQVEEIAYSLTTGSPAEWGWNLQSISRSASGIVHQPNGLVRDQKGEVWSPLGPT